MSRWKKNREEDSWIKQDGIVPTARERKRMEAQRKEIFPDQRRKKIPKVVFSWTFQILIVIMFAYVIVYFFGQTRTNVGQ